MTVLAPDAFRSHLLSLVDSQGDIFVNWQGDPEAGRSGWGRRLVRWFAYGDPPTNANSALATKRFIERHMHLLLPQDVPTLSRIRHRYLRYGLGLDAPLQRLLANAVHSLQNAPPSPIDILPKQLLSRVFTHLVDEPAGSVRAVSRSWDTVARSAGNLVDRAIAGHEPSIRELITRWLAGEVNIRRFVREAPREVQGDFSSLIAFKIWWNRLPREFRGTWQLTHLRLNRKDLFDDQVTSLIPYFPHVKDLEIWDGYRITDQAMRAIGEGMRSLERLCLRGCAEITDEGIRHLVSACTHLQVVDLRWCLSLTDRSVAILAHTARFNLREIYLRCRMGAITDRSLVCLAQRSPLLEKLWLTEAAVTDEGISRFVSKCWNLHEVKLWSCRGVTYKGLEQLLSLSPKMKRLALGGATNLTSTELETLARRYPNVEVVYEQESE